MRFPIIALAPKRRRVDPLRIESERALAQMETARIARSIADAIDADGLACTGQVALRMLAARLDAQVAHG